MKRVKAQPKIDLREWRLSTADNVGQVLGEAVKCAAAEALKHAFEESTYLHFARDVDYSRKIPADPTTLYLSVGLGATEFEDPVWKITLSKIVKRFIEENTIDKIFPEAEDIANATAIRDGLASLVVKLDKVLKKSQPQKET